MANTKETSKGTFYQPTICSVELEYKSQCGTGAIIVLLMEGRIRPLFMTSFQVAPLIDSDEIKNLKLVFKNATIKNFTFQSNWVVPETLWTSPADILNVTVFEISPIASKILDRSRQLSSISLKKQEIITFKYNSLKVDQNSEAGSMDGKYPAGKSILLEPEANAEHEMVDRENQRNANQNKWTIDQIIEEYNYSMIRKSLNDEWIEQFKTIPEDDFQKLGMGMFGEVYKVSDKSGDFYALKLVEGMKEINNYKIQTSDLENEYKLVTSFKLYHPRIVKFFRLVRDDSRARVIIVMEYVPDGTLADKIKSKGYLDKVYSLKYLSQIMEAIEFLHKQKIVHRQIEPDNVLLTANDDIKLCDFFIAAYEDSEKKPGVGDNNLGNLIYSSPERLSENASGPENDIWSVGATFVTMISGHPLNYNVSFPEVKISQFQIYINSISLENFLKELPQNDYKRKIISGTLCPRRNRSNARQLLDFCERLKTIPSGDQPIVSASPAASDLTVGVSSLDLIDQPQPIRPCDNLDFGQTILKVSFEKQLGTGAIYGYQFPDGTWRELFITSYQVLPITDAKDIADLKLELKDDKYLNITPKWVQRFWTSPPDKLNVSVIEFSPSALSILSTTEYARLISSTPEINSKVTVYDYKNKTTNGIIITADEDTITFTTARGEGHAGVPLLNENLEVIGIHTETWETSDELDKVIIRKAIKINSILYKYSNYILEALGGKTENEFYLEKIRNIPKRDFDSMKIGEGTFGKVYKIQIQTDLAVKIVKMEQMQDRDYERNIKALKMEYGIVTSLDNHPRIVKFFALISDDVDKRLMLIMEYLESGTLKDKLKEQIKLSDYKSQKYLMQILEGVKFLHERSIFHSDIKPANILFTTEDNLKVCDFGISVKLETQSNVSSSSSFRKGTIRYRSPERMIPPNNAKRSAENDIWSIGATYVEMITGHYLNHLNPQYLFEFEIFQYKIFIDGISKDKYIQSLRDEFKKTIITKTLCRVSERAKSEDLLSITAQSFSRAYTQLNQFARCISKRSLKQPDESDQYDPNIWGMCYNSGRDELFFADYEQNMVRAIRLRDNSGKLYNVYRVAFGKLYSVCHISDSDTLLVCSYEQSKYCLVALSRSGDECEWREAQREYPETSDIGNKLISCALSSSRVLVGKADSKYLELFRVEDGEPLRIESINRIIVAEEYTNFAATCGSDILVAMSCVTNTGHTVRVHRLLENRLEEIACTEIQSPVVEEQHLLWIDDRLLVTEWESEPLSNSIMELELNNTNLERRHTVILSEVKITVHRWCRVDDGLVIFDKNSRDILEFKYVKH